LLFDDELGRSLKTGKKVRALKGEVVEVDGAPGAFEVLLEGGERAALRCGAIVVAFDPAPIDIAVGAKRLEEMIQSNKVPASVGIVADSWNPASSPPELDRVLSYSFRLKAARPDAQILIVVRDIHASGAIEELQREAQKAGVSFARSEQPPKIGRRGSAEIVAHDQVLGPLSFRVDEVVDLRSERNEECARACAVLGIATRPDGTPREAKARLEGGESLKGGVFVFDAWTEWCAADVLLDSSAIAGRVQELLGSPIEEGGAIAQVEEGKCSACLTCVRICPYGAPRMNDDMKAIIKFELCQGCGMCVTACPSKAIDMHCYSDQQLATEAHAALGGRR
jgi:heterodisulfide reductase subunit A